MCSKTTAFSLSLLCGTTHATLECQTEVRENAVSKYHFPISFTFTFTWRSHSYLTFVIPHSHSRASLHASWVPLPFNSSQISFRFTLTWILNWIVSSKIQVLNLIMSSKTRVLNLTLSPKVQMLNMALSSETQELNLTRSSKAQTLNLAG